MGQKSATEPPGSAAGPSGSHDAGPTAAADGGDVTPSEAGPTGNPTTTGPGTISGSPGAEPFPSVQTALWIGSPDSAATTVVYLFPNSVTCNDLTGSWDETLPNKTPFLELKVFGKKIGSYTVQHGASAAGQAIVTYNVARVGTEVEADSGKLTLDAIGSADVTGTFDATWSGKNVKGTFHATFCPNGVEP
jgi:hypothetical protein